MLRFFGIPLFLCLAPLWGAAQGDDKPTLISLDYCADQFVLGLADDAQILALSPDAESDFSYYREKAAGFVKVRMSAEDILAYAPDKVVRYYGGSSRDLDFFKRFGIEVVQINGDADGDWQTDFEDLRAATLAVGEAIGQTGRAEALVRRLSVDHSGQAREVIYFTPGGAVAGSGTMVGAIIEAAGLENGAGTAGWSILSLEELFFAPPEFALTAFFDFQAEKTSHWSAGGHPLMDRILANADTLALREDRVSCPSWLAGDEAADLSRQIKEAAK